MYLMGTLDNENISSDLALKHVATAANVKCAAAAEKGKGLLLPLKKHYAPAAVAPVG